MSYMDTFFFPFQGRIEGGANPVYISIFFTFSGNPHDIFKKKKIVRRGGGRGEDYGRGLALFKESDQTFL